MKTYTQLMEQVRKRVLLANKEYATHTMAMDKNGDEQHQYLFNDGAKIHVRVQTSQGKEYPDLTRKEFNVFTNVIDHKGKNCNGAYYKEAEYPSAKVDDINFDHQIPEDQFEYYNRERAAFHHAGGVSKYKPITNADKANLTNYWVEKQKKAEIKKLQAKHQPKIDKINKSWDALKNPDGDDY